MISQCINSLLQKAKQYFSLHFLKQRKFPYAASYREHFLTHTPNTRIKYFLATLKLPFDANINIQSPTWKKLTSLKYCLQILHNPIIFDCLLSSISTKKNAGKTSPGGNNLTYSYHHFILTLNLSRRISLVLLLNLIKDCCEYCEVI